jgi:hypothetical protein
MQELFAGRAAAAFRKTLSETRFARYLVACKGNEFRAICLYLWNTRLSQSFYLPLQNWEVALRNRLNAFLTWRYGALWPYAPRVERELKAGEARRLREARERQEDQRGLKTAPTDTIVADLTGGFWTGLLSGGYDVLFSWRYNLRPFVFPNDPTLDRKSAHGLCADMNGLRNRIAHYEPIYHLPLDEYRADLDRLLEAMCPATNAYTRASCTFSEIWDKPP